MKKFICLPAIFLLLCTCAPGALAETKKTDFITLTFPRGVTLDVPSELLHNARKWMLTSPDYDGKAFFYLYIEIKKRPMPGNESWIIKPPESEKENYILLAGRSFEYLLGVNIVYSPPGINASRFGQEDVAQLTPSEMEWLGNHWFSELQEFYAPRILSDWSGISKLTINGFIVIHYSFKQQFSGGLLTEKQFFEFFLYDDGFALATWAVNGDTIKAAPDIQKILKSVRFVKDK